MELVNKILLVVGCGVLLIWLGNDWGRVEEKGSDETKLPPAQQKGKVSLEETLDQRRSVRRYKDTELTRQEVAQLLWAANGKNRFRRTVPSAGAIYPMEVYAVDKNGIYHYRTETHSLKLVKTGDHRKALADAALGQDWVEEAPFTIVITGNYKKCARRYGERAQRYVHIEAGHIGQNIYLQAVALGLGTVAVGAFHDQKVKQILGLPEDEAPLYIFPVGHPAE